MLLTGLLITIYCLSLAYATLSILKSSVTTTIKASWIAVVALLPIIGVLAWYLTGPKEWSPLSVSHDWDCPDNT